MYIKKQPLLEKCKSLAGGAFSTPLIIEAIEKAEGIDIVFCKECKHKVLTDDGEYCPFDIVCDYHMSDGFDENDFCSRGERGTYGGAE